MAAAFSNAHAEYQKNCSAALVAVLDSGMEDGHKKIGN